MEINILELKGLVRDGFVNETKHPTEDLWIYNYTQKAQYEGVWTDLLLQCRGLILDAHNNVVARPLKKFFNLSEYGPAYQLPNGPFEIYKKLDGSCLISYWIGNKMYWATRGSFTSDQAIAANKFWQEKFPNGHTWFHPRYTYVAEWIAPENRIVVDYGDTRDIILTAVIHTESGEDENLGIVPPIISVVPKYPHTISPYKLHEFEVPNEEGFVVKYWDGFRVKVKFAEYVRLHAITTNTSSYDIWDALRNGTSLEEILDRVPDEFYDWVKDTEQEIIRHHAGVIAEVTTHFYLVKNKLSKLDREALRKDYVTYFKEHKYRALLFAKLDGRDVEKMAWDYVKPKYQKPFSNTAQ